ncbi:MAG: 6-carboxytetrahydropterin synthase, partial [Polaromonas sp.]|nr:6-carboxytetrahydropterin synthase [Polaromonas sp.]
MSYQISQRFFFDAAHTLRRQVEADASRRVHGHTYQAEITLAGEPDAATGMVVDLGLVRQAIAAVRDELDHRMLDDIAGLGPATLENLCAFIWRQLAARLPTLSAVRVWRDAMGDA